MKKILFIRLSSLGDIILTEPCVRITKELLPDAELHYLTKPEYSEIIENFGEENDPLINKIHLWQNEYKIKKNLNHEKYDIIIDLQNKFCTFYLMKLCKAKLKITYQKQHLTRRLIVLKLTKKTIDSVVWNYLNTLYKIPEIKEKFDIKKIEKELLYYPRLNPNINSISEVIDIFSMYNIPHTSLPICHPIQPICHSDPERSEGEESQRCFVPQHDKVETNQLSILNSQLSTLNSQLPTPHSPLPTPIYKSHIIVGIFPGSQHFTKQYPIERLVNFLLDIPNEWNCNYLVMGDWKDKHHAIQIKALSEMKIFDLTGAFTLKQLIAAVSLCDIIITNDSGPMHIAAALKKPQIAIFGATHPKLGFRPLNTKAVTLHANIKCQPCSLHGGKSCRRDNLYCFRNISSDEVFENFKILYDEISEI